MLASRYPILDARYECYPNGRGEDALAAKGALFAKVRGFTLLLIFYPIFDGILELSFSLDYGCNREKNRLI